MMRGENHHEDQTWIKLEPKFGSIDSGLRNPGGPSFHIRRLGIDLHDITLMTINSCNYF